MEDAVAESRNQLSENDEKDRKNMLVVLKTLRSQAVANMEYFQVGSDATRSRFHAIFCLLHDHLERGIEPFVDLLFGVASQYDACGVRANGYRSLLKIIQRCCITVLQLTRHICVNKDSILFRSSHYCKQLEAYVTTLGQLRACLVYVEKLPEWSEEGSLFADEDRLLDQTADELMMEVESLNQECFYGRCLGFQYCESLQKPFQMIAIAMASFSDGFTHDTSVAKFASSVMSSGKYFMNPELRAQQVIATTTNADIGFCKAFWNLTEHDFLKDLHMIVCPPVHLSQPIVIHPDSFELPRRDGKGFATILPPTAHRGPGPIYCRLISHEYREGQEQLCKKDAFSLKSAPPSPCLIIHCHGGGFVAQSSKSHETYLRHWARDLRVPILSIDYSLAPEDPFPRAVEEVFFVYAWALDNCDLLGSTGEHICICGDSAGGNLTLSICIKAIQEGIRLPDGIMAAYPALLVRFTPTPSRLLAIMDPLLPVGVLSRCLAAYAGVAEADIPKYFAAAKRRNSSYDAIRQQPHHKGHKRRHSTSLTGKNGSPVKFMLGEDDDEDVFGNVLCMSCQNDRPGSMSGVVVDPTLSDLADKLCEEEFSDVCSEKIGSESYGVKTADGATTPKDESPSKDAAANSGERGKDVGAQDGVNFPTLTDTKSPNTISAVEGMEAMTNQNEITAQKGLKLDLIHESNRHVSGAENNSNLSEVKIQLVQGANASVTPCSDSSVCSETVLDDTLEKSSSLSPSSQENASVSDERDRVCEGLEERAEIMQKVTHDDSVSSQPMDVTGFLAVEGGVGFSQGDRVPLTDEFCDEPGCDKGRGNQNLKLNIEMTEGMVPGDKSQSVVNSAVMQDSPEQLTLNAGVSGVTLISDLEQSVGLSQSETADDRPPQGAKLEDSQLDSMATSVSPSVTMLPRKVSCEIPKSRPEYEGVVIGREAGEFDATNSGDEGDEDIKSDTVDSGISNSEEEWAVYEEEDIKALKSDEERNGAVSGASLKPSTTKSVVRSKAAPGESAWSSLLHTTWAFSNKLSQKGLKLQFSNLSNYIGLSKKGHMRKSPSTPTLPTKSSFHPAKNNISSFKNITHPLHHFRYLPVTKDPLMSPYLASDEILKQLPPVHFVAAHLDPLLDDSVMFAKRLHSLGKEVHLDVLEEVPHGFLNFVLVSKEAKRASDKCVVKIREILMRNMKSSTPPM